MTFRSRSVGVIALALLVVATGCNRQRDDRLERVRNGTLTIGVAENRPWTTLPGDAGAAGIEGALVAELARELGARVEWVRAPESQLLHALETGDLDIVIAGLTDGNPWKQRVAFTQPFYTDTVVVAGPPGTTALQTLEGRTVAVLPGHRAASFVRRRGGEPRTVPDLAAAPGLVAMPTWLLSRFGFVSTGIVLYEAPHVIALAPDDQKWLDAVEASLAKRAPLIGDILRQSRP